MKVDIKELAKIIALSLVELTKEELEELQKELKDTYGLEPTVPEIVEVLTTETEEASKAVSVIITEVGASKAALAKYLKAEHGLGLKDAMDAVKSLPYTVVSEVPEEEANDIKEKLIGIGAEVEVS